MKVLLHVSSLLGIYVKLRGTILYIVVYCILYVYYNVLE